MISTIHPNLKAGTPASIQSGSVVFPTQYPSFKGLAILVARENGRFLVWPNDQSMLEEVDLDQALLQVSNGAHLAIDLRSQLYLRADDIVPQPGMIVLASGKDHPLLVVQRPKLPNLVVDLTDWTVQAMPRSLDIAFTKWSVWSQATLGRVDDHPLFEITAA